MRILRLFRAAHLTTVPFRLLFGALILAATIAAGPPNFNGILTVPGAPTPPPGSTIVFFGDSITQGTGASSCNGSGFVTGAVPTPHPSPSGTCYADKVAAYYGATEANAGISGSTVEATPSPAAAINRYTTDLLPDCTAANWLVMLYGINDVRYSTNALSGNFYPAQFQSNLDTIINACINNGMPANHIILVGLTYADPANYINVSASLQPLMVAHNRAFTQAIAAVAYKYHTQFANAYDYMALNGGTSILNDHLHPNDTGHAILAQAVEGAGYVLSTMADQLNDAQTYAGGYSGTAANIGSDVLAPGALTFGASSGNTTITAGSAGSLILNPGVTGSSGAVYIGYGSGATGALNVTDGGTSNWANYGWNAATLLTGGNGFTFNGSSTALTSTSLTIGSGVGGTSITEAGGGDIISALSTGNMYLNYSSGRNIIFCNGANNGSDCNVTVNGGNKIYLTGGIQPDGSGGGYAPEFFPLGVASTHPRVVSGECAVTTPSTACTFPGSFAFSGTTYTCIVTPEGATAAAVSYAKTSTTSVTLYSGTSATFSYWCSI